MFGLQRLFSKLRRSAAGSRRAPVSLPGGSGIHDKRRRLPKWPRMWLEQLEDRLALATYNVGAGLAYPTIGAVPWNNLQPGDVVNINWQANPYHEKIILSNSGTPTQPIVIN